MKQKKEKLLMILCGIAIGLVNGLFGGGGGMIAVPLLCLVLNRPEKEAHATALLVILPVSLISGIIYLINGNFIWDKGLLVGTGVLVGGIIGALLLKKLPVKIISYIFIGIMATAGIYMMIK